MTLLEQSLHLSALAHQWLDKRDYNGVEAAVAICAGLVVSNLLSIPPQKFEIFTPEGAGFKKNLGEVQNRFRQACIIKIKDETQVCFLYGISLGGMAEVWLLSRCPVCKEMSTFGKHPLSGLQSVSNAARREPNWCDCRGNTDAGAPWTEPQELAL